MKGWLVLIGLMVSMHSMAQCPGCRLEGLGSAVIPVTVNKMTNVIFPVAVRKGVKVSKNVLVQQVAGVENVIELKAARAKFAATNLSVFGVDGRLYSFVVVPVEDTSVLNFRVVGDSLRFSGAPVMLSGLPVDRETLHETAVELADRRGFMRHSVVTERLRLTLTGVYLRDSLEWLVFNVRNRSLIGWSLKYYRFFLQDRHPLRRGAVQEVTVMPVYDGMAAAVGGGATVSFVMGFRPFTVPRGKRLVVEIAGEDGGRGLELTIKGRVLLRARE